MKKLIICVLLGLVLAGCAKTPVVAVTVSKVYDGDSFRLSNGDEIRLIGIDAPEWDNPGAEESRAFLINLIEGKPIRLEADKEDKDKYHRLLRYAYIGETFINAEMIKNGYAKTLFIPPNDKYRAEFSQLEAAAQESKKGLWAPDAPVYITDFGEKYHRAGCRHLAKSKTATTLKDAKQKNYEPCKQCRPPE